MDIDTNELWREYELDSSEAFEELEASLLELESNPGKDEPVNRLYRGLHTLKGNSGFLGLANLEQLGHAAEDLVGLVRDHGVRIDGEMTDVLLGVVDKLRQGVTMAASTRADVPPSLVADALAKVRALAARKRPGGAKAVSAAPPPPAPLSIMPEAPAAFIEEPSLANVEPIDPRFEPGYLEIFLGMAREKLLEVGEAIAMLEMAAPALPDDADELLTKIRAAADDFSFAAERMDYVTITDVLRALILAAKPELGAHSALAEHERALYGMLVRVEETYREVAKSPSDFGFISIYRRTCADRVFASLAQLREFVEGRGQEALMHARQVQTLFQDLRACCEYYGFDGAVRSCLDQEDRYCRAAEGTAPLDGETLARTRDFIEQLGSAVDAVNRGDAVVPVEGFEGKDDPMKYAEAAADHGFSAELALVVTRTHLGQISQLLSEGYKVYEIRADLESDETVAEAFQIWAMSGEVRLITNASVLKNETTRLDFLIASTADADALAQRLRIVDPSGKHLRVRVPTRGAGPISIQAAPEPARLSARPLPAERRSRAPSFHPPAAPPVVHFSNVPPPTIAEKTELPIPKEEDAGGSTASKDSGSGASEFLRIDSRKVSLIMDLAGEIGLAAGAVTQHPGVRDLDIEGFTAASHKLEMLIRELQNEVSSMRLVPIAGVFSRMRRVVRDAARRTGKQVDLVLVGEDTEIDKIMVDSLQDPLVHMLRNAVDHGVETPEQRRAAGKEETGKIILEAAHEAGEVVITVADDGRGVDRDQVLTRARKKGLIAPDAHLTDEETLMLLCAPGFSTKEQITELSGRGVGMDVVRSTIEGMRGRLTIRSALGKGSQITMRMPLTLAFVEAMIVRERERLYVLPIEKVYEVFKADKEQLVMSSAEGRVLVRVRDSLLPVCWIHQFYGEPSPAICSTIEGVLGQIVVVVQTGMGRVALPVDQLLGNQQVMLKPLKGALSGIRAAAGCGMLRSGDVAVALDCDQIHA